MIVTVADLLQKPSFKALTQDAMKMRVWRWRKKLGKQAGQAITLEEIATLLGVKPEEI